MTHYDETTGPPPPEPEEPSDAWEHFELWQAVRKALFTERQTAEDVAKGMDRLAAAVGAPDTIGLCEKTVAEIATKIADICRLLRPSPS
ncbi:MAG: hypothetical protein A49_25100 [Methyloceanibacter sp.]|nr:MAG: hypothetical protein A49_25100 [Methyloceanibacter sp.]